MLLIDARRPRLLAVALATTIVACAPPTSIGTAASPRRGSPRALLAHEIDSLLDAPMFRTAEWAVLVVDPQLADTIYAHNAQLLMVPASNMKIVTSSVALTQLGGQFRYTTTFAAHGPVENGVLHGDLVVTGRGDPTMSDHVRGSARAALDSLADSIAAHGIHSITGKIYAGADNFPGAPVGEGWSWNDLRYDYGAGVGALMFNEGMSTLTPRPPGDTSHRAIPAPDPTRDYLAELSNALVRRGVTVSGEVGDNVVPQDGVKLDTLFVTQSLPLVQILPYLLKPSQNQIAEVLMRTVGLEKTGVGTADSGIAVAKRQLTEWGVPRDGYVIEDGSGLSRADLLSPETIVRVFDRMQSNPDFAAYYAALPIAGVDGTIKSRMRGTPAANNVHAKTGSLGWVRSLSGYVTDADGRRLIFSILANKWTTRSIDVTSTADSIAAHLAAYRQ